MTEERRAKFTITVDLSDYSGEVEQAIRDCIGHAVNEAIYDVIKADVRRAYLASDLRETMLPKIVDETLKRMVRETA